MSDKDLDRVAMWVAWAFVLAVVIALVLWAVYD